MLFPVVPIVPIIVALVIFWPTFSFFSIGIKNNKLALFELTNNYTDSEGKSGYAQTSIEISNYNKTKVDEDDLEDLLKEAKLYEEEQRAKQQSYYNYSYYNDYYYGY